MMLLLHIPDVLHNTRVPHSHRPVVVRRGTNWGKLFKKPRTSGEYP
jgi:hypothetical protein